MGRRYRGTEGRAHPRGLPRSELQRPAAGQHGDGADLHEEGGDEGRPLPRPARDQHGAERSNEVLEEVHRRERDRVRERSWRDAAQRARRGPHGARAGGRLADGLEDRHQGWRVRDDELRALQGQDPRFDGRDAGVKEPKAWNPTINRNHLIRDAIGLGIYDCMKTDPSIYLFGEGASMKMHFDCPAIEKEFPERIVTLPISEDGNTDFAVGASLAGVKPVVDVITSDFLFRTM